MFDGTPAAKEGTLQSGDELLAVNGVSVKGKTKVSVAKMVGSRFHYPFSENPSSHSHSDSSDQRGSYNQLQQAAR